MFTSPERNRQSSRTEARTEVFPGVPSVFSAELFGGKILTAEMAESRRREPGGTQLAGPREATHRLALDGNIDSAQNKTSFLR